MSEFITAKTLILSELDKALSSISSSDVEAYLSHIEKADKVFFIGVGRVKLALECIAKRYAHLGIDAHIVGGITEPAITANDLLIVASGSGETLYPLCIAKKASEIGATILHIGSNPNSKMSQYENFFIRIPAESKAKLPDEVHSIQPMTSLFEQSLLIFGDITALMMVQRHNIDIESLWQFHANLE